MNGEQKHYPEHFRFFSLLLTMLIIPGFSFAQQNIKLEKSIECKGSFIAADKMGNVYVIDGNSLIRYDSTASETSTYSNVSDGQFTSVDLTDPMKIMLFCREFGHLRFFDNTLSQKGSDIALSELGYSNATLACVSYASGFWIYDPSSIQLIRFDNSLTQSQFTGNIAQLAGFEINPVFLIENDNLVYLADTSNGILVFDRYGTYLRNLPFKNVKSLQFNGDVLIMFTGKEMDAYNVVSQSESFLTLTEASNTTACLSRGKLYVLTGSEMKIYTIE
jgi:hypothetical protein